MKKGVALLVVLAGFAFIVPSVSAASGSWYSAWGYDINGISSVGTTNAESRALYFQFRVVRAGSVTEGIQRQPLGQHQSHTYTVYGTVLRDKQGSVSVSPGDYHTPWFNP